jgi:anti-sigma28 factor (negative regulator of flagellin synthesis)
MPASKKKAASKKKSKSTAAAITLKGAIPKMTLELPLDDDKIAQIKRCIAKGKMSISVSRVDLIKGRLGDPYKYD